MTKMIVSVAIAFVLLTADSFPSDSPHKSRTGTTQKFGSGTITNRSDGSSSITQPFGNGTITREREKGGHTVTGTTQNFGSGTITNRSDGSTSKTQKFGSGMMTTDKPGRSSR